MIKVTKLLFELKFPPRFFKNFWIKPKLINFSKLHIIDEKLIKIDYQRKLNGLDFSFVPQSGPSTDIRISNHWKPKKIKYSDTRKNIQIITSSIFSEINKILKTPCELGGQEI